MIDMAFALFAMMSTGLLLVVAMPVSRKADLSTARGRDARKETS